MKPIPAIAFIVGIAFFIGSFAATIKQSEVTEDRAALCENQGGVYIAARNMRGTCFAPDAIIWQDSI